MTLRVSHYPIHFNANSNAKSLTGLRQNQKLKSSPENDFYKDSKSFGFLLTELEDNGNGIGEGQMSNLFKVFGQKDELGTSGVGLGLSTAKQLTEAL